MPFRHVYRYSIHLAYIYICMYISYYYLYILWYKGLRGVWDTRVSVQDPGNGPPFCPNHSASDLTCNRIKHQRLPKLVPN